jgi:protein-tyrosine phosphatase
MVLPTPRRNVNEPPPDRAPERAFSVLAVCTGNICRSPAVERLLRAGLGPGVTVTSAGTQAVVGAPIAPIMARLLADDGVPADDFVARQLTATMIREADLVLPLTRSHRGDVVRVAPVAVRRSFTLRELARLLRTLDPGSIAGSTPAERLAEAVRVAPGRRHLAGDAALDDVVDPWGRDGAVYERAYGELRPAVDTLVAVARG